MDNKKYIILKILIVTLITVVLSKSMVMIPLDFSAFSSNNSGSINQFDIYTDILSRSGDIEYEDNVVVVTIPERAGRAELAEALSLLAQCQPATISVDIHLEGKRDAEVDSMLLVAVGENENVIFPCFTDKLQDTTGFFIQTGEYGISRGYVNLDNFGKENAVMRTFTPYYVDGNDTIYSLSLEAVRRIFPEKVERLKQRKVDHDFINYMREIPCFNYKDIPIFADEITGKIVLLGCDAQYDTHRTPINSRLLGLKVHAYTASTVINEAYIDRPATWVTTLITILTLGVFSFLSILYVIKTPKFAGFFTRSTTYLSFFTFLILGFIVFYEYNLYIDSAWFLIGIAFAPWSLDLYNFIETMITKLKKRIKSKKDNNLNT